MLTIKQLREKLDQLEQTFSPETIKVLGKFEDQSCYVMADKGVIKLSNISYNCEFGLVFELQFIP